MRTRENFVVQALFGELLPTVLAHVQAITSKCRTCEVCAALSVGTVPGASEVRLLGLAFRMIALVDSE